MAESVIVTGRDLTIEHTSEADPKRRRPPEYVAPPAPTGRRTLEQISADPNPYWPDEANRYAEENPDGLTPKQLAKLYHRHRIER